MRPCVSDLILLSFTGFRGNDRSAGRCYGQGPEIRSGASRDYREPHRGRRAAPDPSLSPGLVVDGSTARRVALRPQSHAGGVPFLPADPGEKGRSASTERLWMRGWKHGVGARPN